MATTRSQPTHGHRTAQSGGGGGRGGSGSGGGRVGPGGRRRRRKRSNPFLLLLNFVLLTILFLALIGVAVVSAVFLATMKTMPSTIAQIENYQPAGQTLIYSSDGVVLAKIFRQNRDSVSIDKIPATLQNATVAIEDDRFWTNKTGFDPRGIARALWQDVRGGDATAQGGSTITQQLVRNLGIGGITRQKTLSRKIREVIYANQIERNYSKQQILEMYLNAVYYGSGAYGVQAASEIYFGKNVGDLDLAQCALLAGLPQYPNGYSPYNNPIAAKARRDTVLSRMHDLGYVDDRQYRQAIAEPIRLAFAKQPNAGSRVFRAPYFVDYVVKYLTDRYGSDFVYRGGIKVVTTLNWQMQQAAQTALTEHLAAMRYTGADQAALVCLEAQTGYIKAMVGGVSYAKSQFNIAAFGRRQPGSSFKPVYYTAALDSGIIKETTLILDAPISLPGANGKPWRPMNDDDRFHGWVQAKEAIEQSMNVPSVKVMEMVGVPTAIRYARMMGIRSPLAPYLTLALGASAVTPLEMADVYATIDDGGERPIPTPVMQITTNSGQVLEDDVPKVETTGISAAACAEMSDMLRGVITDGTAAGAFRDGQPPDAHGKTGTTQDHRDVWFDGYTRDLVTTIWAGHPSVDPKTGKPIYLPMTHEAFGATICAPIWHNFMVAATAIEAKENARQVQIDKARTPIVVPAPASPQPTQQTTPPASQTDTDSDEQNPTTLDQTDQTDRTTGGTPATQQPSDATTPVWVDNDTGQPTSPNAPNSHQEIFAPGYAPSTPRSSDQANPPPPPAADQPTAPPAAARRTDMPAPIHKAQAAEKLVTVTVCAESGLLATKWCPETITETFVAGTQPKRYCNIHKPPPGE